MYFSGISLEEKLSHLEDENHVLRQKALSVSPKSNRSGLPKAFSDVSKFTDNSCKGGDVLFGFLSCIHLSLYELCI